MAESVAALGLAANILQFIDFTSRVASNFRKLYNSQHQDYEDASDWQRINSDLQQLLQGLQVPNAECSQDTGLVQLAKDCQNVAGELDTLLQSLFKADIGSHGRYQAFKASFRLVWKEKELCSLQERIDHFRNQLVIHLLTSLREQSHKSLIQQREILDQLKAASGTSMLVNGPSFGTFEDDGFGTRVLNLLARKFEKEFRDDQITQLKTDLITAIRANEEADDTKAHVYPPTILETRRLQLHQAFLRRLYYRGMEDREARVPEAYESTFQWIWQSPSQHEKTWSSFVDWLRSDSQLYWITGKAGSGKSTLMKYISNSKIDVSSHSGHSGSNQPCYRTFLNHWAKDRQLIVPLFFFWNSGLELQMTQTGLFRSLLYQICDQAPELLPIAFAKQWEAACLFDARFEWTDQQLQHGLQCIANNLGSNRKLCIFVDGLDEFAGDHSVLIVLFQKLMRSPFVKLCVASRPWVVFEDAFRDKPSLMLQDLTYTDIRRYVSSNLYGDPGFSLLQEREPVFAEQLVENVVTKASGVFLWVYLVVSSLLSGLGYGDRISDIQRRLDILPSELEHLYDKILSGLDPFYLEHAAQLFKLVQSSPTPPSILLLAYADEAEDIQKVLEQPTCRRTPKETDALYESMRRRLNSRCKGFLETASDMHSATDDTAAISGYERRTIQYLHRTVKDYIESDAVQKKLQSAMKAAFSPHIRLCAGYLGLIKSSIASDITFFEHSPIWINVKNFMMCAGVVSSMWNEQLICLMDELDRTCTVIAQAAADYHPDISESRVSGTDSLHKSLRIGQWVTAFPRHRGAEEYRGQYAEPPWQHGCGEFGGHFISLAIGFGITKYVRQKVNSGCLIQRTDIRGRGPEFFSHNDVETYLGTTHVYPLLLDAMILLEVPQHDMVQCLLEKGASPNVAVLQHGEIWTIWNFAMQVLRTHLARPNYWYGYRAWFEVVTMMIEKSGGDYTPRQRKSILADIGRISMRASDPSSSKHLICSECKAFLRSLAEPDPWSELIAENPDTSKRGFWSDNHKKFRRIMPYF